jgi:hypothetical protein
MNTPLHRLHGRLRQRDEQDLCGGADLSGMPR